MAVKTLKAVTRLVEGVRVESESRGFKVTMDEPVEEGGTNQGMNPMEMLLCALGGCQTITAKISAKAYGVELQDFWVEIEGDLDRPMKRGTKPGYTEVRFKMHIKSNSPEDKIQKFVQFIEKNCPVGDTVMNPVKFAPAEIVIER